MIRIDDGIPQFSAMATSMTTLLTVVVESLHGCDWPTLSNSDPISLMLWVSYLLIATSWNSNSKIRERAVGLLSTLVQMLCEHTDDVSCKWSIFLLFCFMYILFANLTTVFKTHRKM